LPIEKKEYREIVDTVLEDLATKSPLTDSHIGSVSRTTVETIGREVSTLYDQMEAAYYSGFIDTANGRALDMVISILGLTRKSAQFASGTVTFSRKVANQDVTILRGTRISTKASSPEEVTIFETTSTVTIPKGVNEVESPIRALVPGEPGVAEIETITVLENPIIGVDNVVNKSSTSLGSSRESDEQFRERAKAYVQSAGKSTCAAIKNQVLGIPGVKDVAIKEKPNGIPGEVDVIVDGLDLNDPESPAYQNVKSEIDLVRPAGITVFLSSTDLIKIRVELYVRLKEALRTDEEIGELTQSIQDLVAGFFQELSSGDRIVRNRLLSELFAIEDIANVDELNLYSRLFDKEAKMMVDDTRKRTDPVTADLTFGPYERGDIDGLPLVYTQYTPRVVSHVFVDLDVAVTPSEPTITDTQIKEAVEEAAHHHLHSLRGGEDIDYSRIKNIIANLEGVQSVKEFTISALHEDSGLTAFRAKENLKTHETERTRLRSVEVRLA